MTTFTATALGQLLETFEPHRDPARGSAMAAYMRNLFPFLGIPTPERRRLARAAIGGLKVSSEGELGAFALRLWEQPEREYQYVGCDILIRNIRYCGPTFLATAERLITTKAWWDTVDPLASRVVGPLIAVYPQLLAVMDRWVGAENFWLARAAPLHQLTFKARTDHERLFEYCLGRAPDREFFIRKAIGWALREYSKVDGDAVRGFVAQHDAVLSGLSRREALLWLDGARKTRGRSLADAKSGETVPLAVPRPLGAWGSDRSGQASRRGP